MNLKYKKSNLVEGMGYNQVLPTFYGKKPQNIKLTESQFKRLVEGYMEGEDKELEEMNFGDEMGDNLSPEDNFTTQDFNQQLEECGEGGYEKIDHSDRSTYDGRPSRVVGAYDDDLTGLSREDEIYEDYTDIDHSDRDEFDGRKSKVIGVDSNIDKQRELEEDSMDRETKNYGKDESADKRKEDDLEAHLHSLKSDMGYDQSHEW